MNLREQIIKIAKTIGFESKIALLILSNNLGDEKNNYGYYLWLCELKKWLIDIHNIQFSFVTELENGILEYYIDVWTVDRNNFNCKYSGIQYSDHDALEEVCFEVLKLINK